VVRLLIALLASVGAVCAAPEGMTQEVYKTEFGEQLFYQLHKPSSVVADEKVPLVLFLHGAGERGQDNVKQSKHVVPQLLAHLKESQKKAIVLAPQCPPKMKWVNVLWGAKMHDMPEFPSTPLRLALELVDLTIKNEAVDPNRVYLVGLSMGGFGTWDAISRKPDFFAAAVPICGGLDLAQAKKLTKLPIWVWHGDKDKVVLTSRSRDAIAAIREAGGSPKYTELAGVGHNSWTPASQNTELWDWLFVQKK
jgi:predicted peptidase